MPRITDEEIKISEIDRAIILFQYHNSNDFISYSYIFRYK